LLSVRAAFAEGAGNLSDKERKPEGIQLLDKAESLFNTNNMPYAMASRYNTHNQTALMYLEAAYKAGHTQLANKVKTAILKDLNDQKAYYDYMRNEKEAFYNSVSREADINNFLFQLLEALDKNYNPTATIEQAPGRAADSTELR
jgi:hypothetical protein